MRKYSLILAGICIAAALLPGCMREQQAGEVPPIETPAPIASQRPGLIIEEEPEGEAAQPQASPGATQPALIKMEENVPVHALDWDGDGVNDTLLLYRLHAQSYALEVQLASGGRASAELQLMQQSAAYALKGKEGHAAVCISGALYDENTYGTYLCRYKAARVLAVDALSGSMENISLEGMELVDHIEALGTWAATGYYAFQKDFTPERKGLWQLHAEDERWLSVTRAFPAELREGAGYAPGNIYAGMELLPTAYDPDGQIYFRLRNGAEGRLAFTRSAQGDLLIAGYPEIAYFEGIQYAG